jgi:hypothetical protein
VAWRRRSWRCRRSRRCRCPCSGPAPSPDADGFLSFPRAAVEVVVLGVSTVSRCVRAFPRLDTAAMRLLALTHGVVSGVGRKTPKGLVVGALGLRPRPAFESRGRGRQGKSPKLPWLDRPGGRGDAGFPRASQVPRRDARGQKRKTRPKPGWIREHARTGISACGSAGRGARPIPHARGCGAGRPVRTHLRRGGERIGEEGGEVADAWALPVSG